MKTLILLRHGKSSWDHPELADHDRPLKKRGKRDALRMGQLAQNEGLVPDVILSSSAKRAKETAERFAEANGYDGAIHFSRDLYHAGFGEFLDQLRSLDDAVETVMLVGHNPDLEEFKAQLTGNDDWMPTAAMVQIELPIERWKALTEDVEGIVVNEWQPREVD